jgi:hypothetical protein
MNQRERMLAIAVGALAVLLGTYWLYQKIDNGFDQRAQTIERLETQKRQKERQIMLGKLAQQRLLRYQEQSLPPNAPRAKELYTAWLLQTVTEIGFDSPKVNPSTSGLRSPSGAFKAESFVISGAGSLEQLTRLLHEFYSVDYLHRIKSLNITPQQDPRVLSFTLGIDALSLLDAPESDALHQRPSDRLAASDLQAYVDAIVGRNMFGPPNVPPTLSVADASGQTGREVTITPTASDADPNDRLEYSWRSDEITGARIDPQSGRFTWTPQRTGEFYVTVAVRDDGVPSKIAEKRIKVTVSNPPPPAIARATEEKPKYDQVQFTYVNGITEVNGERQVWMIDRRSGKSYWLREGEKFQIGEFSVQVKHIGPLDVELEWYNRRALVRLGENLAEDKELKGDELINVRELENAS